MEIATFAVSHPTLLADVDAAALPVLREQERSVPNGGALDRTLKVKRKGSICGTRTYTFRSGVVVDVAAFKVSHSVLGDHDATAMLQR